MNGVISKNNKQETLSRLQKYLLLIKQKKNGENEGKKS